MIYDMCFFPSNLEQSVFSTASENSTSSFFDINIGIKLKYLFFVLLFFQVNMTLSLPWKPFLSVLDG